MQICRLTEAGILEFRDYVQILRKSPKAEVPVHLLTGTESAERVADLSLERLQFPSRLEAGQYFYDLFQNEELVSFTRDAGVWSWLSLFFFDQICPADGNGTRKPSRDEARYIPDFSSFRKYYRHLLFEPFHIYETYHNCIDIAKVFLVSPVHKLSEPVEQLASRIDLVSNAAVVEAATRLYVDSSGKEYKRGSSGKGGGTPRRLSKVLDQYDVNFDLHGMTADEILELLPTEFKKFVSK